MFTFNKIPIAFLLFVSLLSLNSAHAETESCAYLSYNGADDWYPFFFREAQHTKGIASDAVNAAAAESGLSLAAKNSMPWKRQLLALKFGQLDIIAGATKTYQTEKHFVFSIPVSQAHLSVFTRRDSQLSINKIDDLKELRGVKLLGTSFTQALDEFVLEKLVVDEAVSLASVFKMLQYGRVDYAFSYREAGARYIQKLGLNDQIENQPLNLSSDSIHVMVAKNNHCMGEIQQLFDQIKHLKETDKLDAIIQRYSMQASIMQDDAQ